MATKVLVKKRAEAGYRQILSDRSNKCSKKLQKKVVVRIVAHKAKLLGLETEVDFGQAPDRKIRL